MDKIFSTRLSEAVLNKMERVTRRLRITKKKFLEEAIESHAERLGREEDRDIWDETLGAWKRREKPETTVRKIRDEFRKSFERKREKAS